MKCSSCILKEIKFLSIVVYVLVSNDIPCISIPSINNGMTSTCIWISCTCILMIYNVLFNGIAYIGIFTGGQAV